LSQSITSRCNQLVRMLCDTAPFSASSESPGGACFRAQIVGPKRRCQWPQYTLVFTCCQDSEIWQFAQITWQQRLPLSPSASRGGRPLSASGRRGNNQHIARCSLCPPVTGTPTGPDPPTSSPTTARRWTAALSDPRSYGRRPRRRVAKVLPTWLEHPPRLVGHNAPPAREPAGTPR
jgi:hypothetical protein